MSPIDCGRSFTIAGNGPGNAQGSGQTAASLSPKDMKALLQTCFESSNRSMFCTWKSMEEKEKPINDAHQQTAALQ